MEESVEKGKDYPTNSREIAEADDISGDGVLNKNKRN